MVILPRERPIKEYLLQAAIRRGFPEMKDELVRIQQGLAGEQYVDRSWQDMQLDEEFYLLHDFSTDTHQIDTLFVCEKFILIVEIKNIAGRIDFDERCHQFTRTLENGNVQGFRNPLDQVRRHQRFLRQLFPDLPVIYVIVLAHPKTIIGQIPQNEPIIHCSGLEFYIRKLLTMHKARLSTEQLQRLQNELLQMHTISNPKLNIDKDKVRTGVLCKQCDYTTQMLFQYGRFICPKCQIKDDGTMLQRAIEDYSLLINEWITNIQFRKFMRVNSIYAANRLLKKLNLSHKGDKKGRKYFISFKRNSQINLRSRK
ncbi:nuclease-related domain-containing protein [Metasolibacillus sp.]|uniref:nuclease-related domain-containing protein n=1 Tax=Metasolibacillus sp. TaxID=2703680 RepID=UPI0025FDC838|nr:nuclease-related domain-containing protein [Metasolibacillus sp.]MCT6923369.1 NERD domain-containing protein [Metasolibacillus sp.]MCT6939908.1 NERD domain-containing protein [Metasolibacillus sp.]